MIDGMITVRSQSSRLPEKCFLEFGNGNVIEHMIRRAKFFKINPIVCTTFEKEELILFFKFFKAFISNCMTSFPIF